MQAIFMAPVQWLAEFAWATRRYWHPAEMEYEWSDGWNKFLYRVLFPVALVMLVYDSMLLTQGKVNTCLLLV